MLTVTTCPMGTSTDDCRTNSDGIAAHKLNRLIFLAAGALLACVSISVAALAGWQRGPTLAESGIWSAAGIALALAAASAPSLILATNGARRVTAVVVYALALSFVIAASLGSQHAGRVAAAASSRAATDERARLESSYSDARKALAELPATRPATVVQSELDAVLRDPRLPGCTGWLANAKLRAVCIERVEPARAELATAVAARSAQSQLREASEALSTLKAEKPANGDAAAIGRYLALLGIEARVDAVSDALNALTVAAVEIVAGLALMLGRVPDCVPNAAALPDGSAQQQSPKPLFPLTEHDRNAAIIERLRAGALTGSQRAIAERLGVPTTSLRNTVERDARLRLTASREGSRLELVG